MKSIKLRDIPIQEPFPGFEGHFVHSERMTFAYWDIAAGSVAPEHTHHPHEQIFHLMEGSFELTVEGEARIFSPDEVMIIPPDVPHAGKALTDCRVVDVFSPVREDLK
jgi:quercetin dioxygenase-like cupin family protein